jgi:hypothetical protein
MRAGRFVQAAFFEELSGRSLDSLTGTLPSFPQSSQPWEVSDPAAISGLYVLIG